MSRPALALFLLVPLLLSAAAAPDKELDAAAEDVRGALDHGTAQQQDAALAALVALADPEAVAVLQAPFAEATRKLRAQRGDLVEKTFTLDRKREMLAAMKVRAERDPALKDVVERLSTDSATLEAEIARLGKDVRRSEELVERLGGAAEALFAGLASGARKKAHKALWDDAEKHPEVGVRVAAVEMLGRVAEPGAAGRLFDVMIDALRRRDGLKRELPKLEAKLREFEQRFQREQDQSDGRAAQATTQQYEALRKEPAAIRTELHRSAGLVAAAAEAGGRALAREQGDALQKSLRSLIQFAKSQDGAPRSATLDLLGHADADPVRSGLRALLAEESEPLARAEIAAALARLGDTAAEPLLIERELVAQSWHVRSRAASALATLRSRAAIPALIARLEVEEGRVKTDVQRALESLTAQRFGSNVALWQRWWKDHEQGFEVPPPEQAAQGGLSAEEAVGVTFFGIRTESRRVLFVLDVSRSMNFSMVPRDNPTDDPSQPFDMPREGEDSRLAAAKRELVKALGGIGDGGVVNLVLYATDVWAWRERPVKVDVESRGELIRYVDALTANGGTNLYGALKHALDLAGVDEGGDWAAPEVDTIYVLSDGRASVGLTTSSEEILSYVRERNRSAGITIHTIGLSGAQDPYLLRSLAEQNGGQYVAR